MDPTQFPTNPNAAPATPMTTQQILAAIEANRQATGQRMAAVPSTISRYSPATDATIASLQNNKADKLKQLFDHDSNLAQTYYQPEAAPGAHITDAAANPTQMIIDPSIGLRAATDQDKATAGEAIDIGKSIDERKTELASNLAQAISLLGLQNTASNQIGSSLESELSAKQDAAKSILNVIAASGGTVPQSILDTLGLTGSDTGSAGGLDLAGTNSALRTQKYKIALSKDAENGMTLDSIAKKYKPLGLTDQDIVETYDSSSKYGPHTEGPIDLSEKGLGSYKGTASQYLGQAAKDVKAGMTLKDLASKYMGSGLSDDQIVSVYDKNSGTPHKESTLELAKMGINVSKNNQQAVIDKTKNTLTAFDALAQAYPSGGALDFKNYAGYNTQKQFLVDQISNNFGISRSNPAIQRLLDALPGPTDFIYPGLAQTKFEKAKEIMNTIAGVKNTPQDNATISNVLLMTSPSGKKYNVPQSQVQEAKKHGYK